MTHFTMLPKKGRDADMKEIVCIVCPNGCSLSCQAENGAIVVTGNRCPRGRDYAITELTNPMRTLTTSV